MIAHETHIHLVISHVKVGSPSWATRTKHPSSATSTGAVHDRPPFPAEAGHESSFILLWHTIFGSPAQAADVHMDVYGVPYHPSPTFSYRNVTPLSSLHLV